MKVVYQSHVDCKASVEGLPGKKPWVTSDKLLDSPSKLLWFPLWNMENLRLQQKSLRVLFRRPLQLYVSLAVAVIGEFNHNVIGC